LAAVPPSTSGMQPDEVSRLASQLKSSGSKSSGDAMEESGRNELGGLQNSMAAGPAVDTRTDAEGMMSDRTSLDGSAVVMRIPVTVQVVLGKLRMPVAELFKLRRGSVLTLDRAIGEPVDLVVNGHLVARGEIVVLEESKRKFGVTLTEIVESPGPV
jgi:flagellar motor switch protein FliN